MAISLALQGYDTKKKSATPPLERSYSFGMFHVPKRDPNKPDFSFGQDEAEFENLRGWVKAIKELPPTLEHKYYDLHMMSSGALIKTEPEEQLPEMDTAMPSASAGPKFYTNFGVTSMNNLISQMPNHPVLNIGSQSREEIKASLNLLQNWTIA